MDTHTPVDGRGPIGRDGQNWFERLPFVVHIVALGGLFLLALMVVTPGEVWSSDEGAIRLQARTLEDTSQWYLDRPFFEIDPEGVTSPIQASTVSGESYAPFTKHPLTPLIVAAAPGSADRWQAVLPSVFAGLVAATIVALIAGWVHAPSRNYTLWATGIATPVFFYSFTVLHHTIGVALAALAVAGAVRYLSKHSRMWLVVSIVAIVALPFVRREGLLLALAIAVGVAATGAFGTPVRRIGVAAVYGAAGGLGAIGNAALSGRLAGQSSVIEGDRAFWSLERLVQSIGTGLTGFDGIATVAAVFVLLYVVGTVLFCWVLVADPRNLSKHLAYGTAAVLGMAGIALFSRPSLSGAFVAMPWVVGGLLAMRRPIRGDPRIRFLVISGLLYVVAVLVTQERHAGGAQWGGRYLMLALPALVPVAVVVLRRALDPVPERSVRVAGVVFLGILVMSGVTSVSVLNAGRERVAAANVQWSLAAEGVGDDGAGHRSVMLSPDSQLGRFGWSRVDTIDFFMIPSHLDRYVERYAELQPDRFVFMGSWNSEMETLFAEHGYGAFGPSDTTGSVDLTVIEPLDTTR
jgi:hypothetical protein